MGLGCRRWWRRWCRKRAFSSFSAFFLVIAVSIVSTATFITWLFFTPGVHTTRSSSSSGCLADDEGSWSIGVFYGDSPFSLKPVEAENIWSEKFAAWPVANPILTCASVSGAGFPSNFVADPFVYIKGEIMFMFYETKSSETMHGDIGVARSSNKGATWETLGIALDEEWHLSYPFVFDFNDEIYMMPESSAQGDLRLYRASKFPMEWRLERVVIERPLVDAVIVKHGGLFWLMGSDHSGNGGRRRKNGELEIYYSSSPLGSWSPHKRNPVYETGDKALGARNGGRPFIHNGKLYRVGQDCGVTYGRRVRVFLVENLTMEDYREVEVPLNMAEPKKGLNDWNGARFHHLDVQKLSSGEWVGLMDGDRVASGDLHRRRLLAGLLFFFPILLLLVVIFSVSFRKCLPIRTWRSLAISIASVAGIAVLFAGIGYLYGNSGREKAYSWQGQYSQFTLLTMTHDARLWNLKIFIKHYSRCPSVREIVIVWNKGTPPEINQLDSAVPLRIRLEPENSLNNRFKMDPLIVTRAVLELDDDIMMTCDDVEKGFLVWRRQPERIVGFYPRLVSGSPLVYRGEKHARRHSGYNLILTGAAFIDGEVAFQRYWSKEAEEGRRLVDKQFNCEDILLNFLYANASSSVAVEYVKPAWAIDTSKIAGAGISKDTQRHYRLRSQCLAEFTKLYGDITRRKSMFRQRGDGWDA